VGGKGAGTTEIQPFKQPVADGAPQLRIDTVDVDAHVDAEHTAWTVSAPADHLLTYMVRYSNDDGRTWRVVAPSLSQSRFSLDTRTVPGGDQCRLQVVAASSGIRTAVVTTESFAVLLKPLQAIILSPESGFRVGRSERLRLLGAAISPDFETAPPDEMAWFSNRDGLLGIGHETWVTGLSVGRHELTLHLPDGLGGESEATISVDVD
jgi:hypothetical protein